MGNGVTKLGLVVQHQRHCGRRSSRKGIRGPVLYWKLNTFKWIHIYIMDISSHHVNNPFHCWMKPTRWMEIENLNHNCLELRQESVKYIFNWWEVGENKQPSQTTMANYWCHSYNTKYFKEKLRESKNSSVQWQTMGSRNDTDRHWVIAPEPENYLLGSLDCYQAQPENGYWHTCIVITSWSLLQAYNIHFISV